jgi:hypothetical protein
VNSKAVNTKADTTSIVKTSDASRFMKKASIRPLPAKPRRGLRMLRGRLPDRFLFVMFRRP